MLRNQGKLAEAREALDAAVLTLDELRAKGDTSEAAAVGLALGLIAQARLQDARGRDSETLPPATRAVAVVEPGAKSADASIALRRTYAAALTQLGFLQQRRDDNEAAIRSLEAARAMYRGIDNLQTDGDAIANFAITTAWLMDALNRLGRPDDARLAGDEARAAATQLLERHPTHMLALRARALVSSNLARVALNELQPARRVSHADDAARDWALLARIDPSNMITKANFIVARQNAAEGLWDLGRPSDSAAKFLDNREVEAAAAASTLVSFNLYGSYVGAAYVTAERGQTASADKLFADAMRYFENYIRSTRQGSFDSEILRALVKVNQVELATAMGDPVRARAAAKGLRENLPKPQPGNAYEQLRMTFNLRRLHLALGWAELQAGDLAAAQVQFRHVAEAGKQLPTLELSNRREAADDAALLAITLAHSGRLDEAHALAVPVLAFQRELHARKTEDQWHKIGLALALLAVAQSTPDKSGALLAEAQATLDSLPAEARGVRTAQTLQGLIAEARRTAG